MAPQCEEIPMMLDQMESASESTPPTVSNRLPRVLKMVGSVTLVLGAAAVVNYTKALDLVLTKTGSIGSATELAQCQGTTAQAKCEDYCSGSGCSLQMQGNYKIAVKCVNGQVTLCDMTGDGGGNSGSCFPGSALVHVESAGEVPIEDLRVGDSVLVAPTGNTLAYEPVLSFLHVKASAGLESDFLVVEHAQGQLRVTSEHLVLVAGGGAKLAKNLLPGDALVTAAASASRVLAVGRARETTGMYAPLTASGTLVVDGVQVSNYANVASHAAAHAFFFVVRLYHRLGLDAFLPAAGGVRDTSDEVHPLASMLHNKYFKVDKLIG